LVDPPGGFACVDLPEPFDWSACAETAILTFAAGLPTAVTTSVRVATATLSETLATRCRLAVTVRLVAWSTTRATLLPSVERLDTAMCTR
jgi:hypothetical protein